MDNRREMELGYTSALELRVLLDEGTVSAEEVLVAVLERHEETHAALNAVVAERTDAALAEARALDALPHAERGPLHGIPWTAKDLVETKDMPLTLGSLPFAGSRDFDYDSVMVAKLKAAGGILWAKTNTPEFGLRPTTENRVYGVTNNPWNVEHTPGGSSGGAAACAAAGLGPLHAGSDGGGSVRIPASCCGVFAAKTTRGRVSSAPIAYEFWAGVTTSGPITRTVRDAALMLDVIAGPVTGDPYQVPAPETSFLEACDVDRGPLRLAWTADPPRGSIDPDVREAFLAALSVFEELGHELVEASPELASLADPWLRIVEANSSSFAAWIPDAQLAQLEPSTLAMFKRGFAMPAPDYCMSVHVGRNEAARVMQWFDEQRVDALLTPTLTRSAPRHGTMPSGEDYDTRWREYLDWLSWCYPFNMTGQPAFSLPCGWSSDGLPIGLQIVGPQAAEERLFSLAADFEEARPWASSKPEFAVVIA
jgi:amidase